MGAVISTPVESIGVSFVLGLLWVTGLGTDGRPAAGRETGGRVTAGFHKAGSA
jgi:hypothetical protein